VAIQSQDYLVSEHSNNKLIKIPIDQIISGTKRQIINSSQIALLADSIKKNGIIHPIVVKMVGNDYILCCGYLRLKAARISGLKKIPCLLTEKNSNLYPIIENFMRENLHPLDEAEKLKNLMISTGLKQCEVVKEYGLSSTEYLSGTLTINNIDDKLKKIIIRNPSLAKHQLIRIGRKKGKRAQNNQLKKEIEINDKSASKDGNRKRKSQSLVLLENIENVRQRVNKIDYCPKNEKDLQKIAKKCRQIIDVINKKQSYASDRTSFLMKIYGVIFPKKRMAVNHKGYAE